MAEMAVSLKQLTGQGVSRTSDYAKAPPEVIEEFLTHPKGLQKQVYILLPALETNSMSN
jgi:hypothetical protein